MRRLALLPAVLLLLAAPRWTRAEQLTPRYFNLAEGKEIIASATCGVDSPGPELYCQLVGANSDQEANLTQNIIQGQQCDYCDPNDDDKKHPPEYAVDGMETWWQSPPLSRGSKYEEVNLTINLGQEFHVAYVYIRMGNSPRPRIWKLEKSKDFGITWSPWQYFADSEHDCTTFFGVSSSTPITRDDSVICTTEYSKIVPLEGGEIPISILNNRPSAKHYFNSTVLQEWTRATNVRFQFMKTKNLLGHLMSVRHQDPTVTRRYFYSIKDISIGGRCMCNGHAEECDSLDQNQPKKLFCRCQHNTCGPQCATCCPGFQQKKWRQSTWSKKFTCEPCNCHNHSDECDYDPEIDEKHLSLDIHNNYEGGGVCKNCKHNTEGINCDRCKATFFRPSDKPLNATDGCQPCNCNQPFHTGNCFDPTGQCECKSEFQSPNCDACSYGYFGYPDCRACECHLNGTIGYHCEATKGQCPCKENFAGFYCKNCAEEYYNYPKCIACDCDVVGSTDNICDVESGNCKCKTNFGGRRCDGCENGYYNYPSCTFCECDSRGTEPEVCNKENGQCLCKEGYGGPRCDQCINGYFGYPDCQPCNCSTQGSPSKSCDNNGKCSCLSNFVGRTCNQCAPGFYNHPECISCECDSHGSDGVSCDQEGKCSCRDNFDGDRCDKCKENFYNFPICEGCNCDPAGIAGTFQGCGSLPAGELCQCKERVEGRICNQCKKLFWNLQFNNPDGCEDCNCNIPGVIGGIGECDGKTGQCICKPAVTGKTCSVCTDGTYNLQESNLFGCSECSCDIGGAVRSTCDKETGQCTCRARIEGKKCDRPVRTHYFPTLHQFKYEAEDGRTPMNRSVRYNFAEDLFPGYSWKGYAVFSPLQNKIIHEIEIAKSSLYRMVMRYVNPNNDPILGTVTITPDSHTEDEQSHKVQFKPQSSNPSFVTVSGAQGHTPSVLVMNPGRYTVTIAIEKSLFLDYFVLLPSEYYEASILTYQVSTPCEIGYKGLCRHYAYPSLEEFNTALGIGGKTNDGSALSEFLTDQDTLEELDESKLPLINDAQPKIHFEPTISKAGPHVVIISYITPPKQDHTTTLHVDVNNADNGKATLYPCNYSSVCRQVVTEPNGKVAVFNFPSNYGTVDLEGEPNNEVAIKNVVIVPAADWSVDYISPKSVCVKKDGKCIQGIFPEAPEATKIELELTNDIFDSSVTPDGIYDNSTKFIYLDGKDDSTVDVHAKVRSPGEYRFVVQYYQPEFPEFNVDFSVQNGKEYDAKVPMPHCPSNGGCRSLVRQPDGNPTFYLNDTFAITVKDNAKKGIWLDYVLVIPASVYTDDHLKKLQFDQTNDFIKKCGSNHFHIDTKEEGFCRDSVFSLTTHYNGNALYCQCDVEGSTSFECEKFGGQCNCKPNIIGQHCNICKTGYYGFPNCRPCNCPSTALCEPDTGACICPPHVTGERCDKCEAETYGFDQIIGCEECLCHPYGVANNDLQCDLLTGHCKCKENIVDRQCDKCKAGHYQFPYCEKCDCDVRGTTEDICNQNNAACQCKDNVQGERCDTCKEGKFNLQPVNEKGCSDCFCFGKTTRCSSATLYRSYVMEMTGWDVAEINEKNDSVEILKIKPQEVNDTHIFVEYESSSIPDKSVIYLSAPAVYLNKKLMAYGGWLNYTVYYETSRISGRAVPAADIVLQGVDTFLVHRVDEQPPESTSFYGAVQLIESNFETKQNLAVTREQLMVVLGDLRGVYIRATYWQPTSTFSLSHVTLDVATESYIPNGELASSVEQCQCPPAYKGLSCEECAKGYYRVKGQYGGSCVKCQCNGHADTCDINTGVCFDCKNGTTGDHCEQCQIGYYGDATIGTPTDCLICACPMPIPSNNFAKGCDVSEDGSRISCDCNEGYYGAKCESCAAGYYGQPNSPGDYCKPCKCSGNIDTNEIGSCDSVSGECLKCLNNTYGQACNLCAPGFYGDAVERKDCKSCDCDRCGMKQCDSYNGVCQCHENVVGANCDSCAPDHWGFKSCQGCRACDCDVASESTQCNDDDGKCKCKPGVEGRRCDRCMVGFWNYTPEGCTSCGCTTGYSRGTSCNPVTGQCECLPGVLGEKCDHCPHRNILDERLGCQTCDKCTHALLNVTDEIEQILDPVANSFKTVSDSYFTNQRLDFINDTINKLTPQVRLLDPGRIDFGPQKEEIAALNNKVYQMKRKLDSWEEDSIDKKERAVENLKSSYKLEQIASKEVALVNTIIGEIQMLASNSDVEDGPRIDSALWSAQSLLSEMKQVSFISKRDKATDQQDNANVLYSEMVEYGEPVKNLTKDTDNVNERVNALSDQIDDMYNLTTQVDDLANAAERLNFENKKIVDSNKLDSLKSDLDQTKEDLKNAEELNKKSQDLYDEAEKNYIALKTNVVPGESTEPNQQLSDVIDKNEKELKAVRSEVSKAIAHASDLNQKSLSLEQDFADTRNLEGVRAASVYQDIAHDIQDARKFAEEAVKAADNATTMSEGVVNKSLDSDVKSQKLLEDARNAVAKNQQDLQPSIRNARSIMDEISDLNVKNSDKLNNIEKSLGNLNVQTSSMAVTEASNNADNAEYVIGEMTRGDYNNNVENIHKDLTKAKQLAKDALNSDRDINQAHNILDSMDSKTLPEIQNKVNFMNDIQQANNNSANSLYDKIEDLKRKINTAREIADTIRIGLTFLPNTVLELRNPESLPLQTTSTKVSVYVNTTEANAFLLYLGNENKTNVNAPRKTRSIHKSPDYMALLVESGNPVLFIDLGSGPQKIINRKNISDGVWRQLIVDRTGRNIKLIVREEFDKTSGKEQLYVTEETLPGSHSIFNLDQEKTKLFVGGYPQSFQMPDPIPNLSFKGQMEDLVIGDVPVSFWNFVVSENYGEPAIKRDKLIPLQPIVGCRFDRDGYVIINRTMLNSYDMRYRFRVRFKFKTWTNSGLMYLSGGKEHFIALELKDGRVLYQVDYGHGQCVIQAPERYNDGEWHTVEASRNEKICLLKVDGKVIGESNGDDIIVSTTNYSYFGGYPPIPHNYKSVTESGFEGCIDDVTLQDIPVDLTRSFNSSGVVAGCPVKFNSLVSFDGVHPGYVRWDGVSVSGPLQVSLKFRTRADNGLIYHLVDQDGIPTSSLSLQGGKLVLDGHRDRVETSVHEIRFNDNEWHVITATQEGSSLRLNIDDTYEKNADTTPDEKRVENGALYVGFVPENARNGLRFDHFVGCIGDATVNGVIVNFANTTERSYAHLAQCNLGAAQANENPSPVDSDGVIANNLPTNSDSGEDLIPTVRGPVTTEKQTTTEEPTTREPETVDGCRLPHYPVSDPDENSENAWRFGTEDGSRFEYNSLNGRYRDDFDFQVEIKTLASEGIIFYGSDLLNGNTDLIALYVQDGRVHYKFDCGSGPALIVSDNKINDHQWHTIVFKRQGYEGALVVDDLAPITGTSQGTTDSMSVQPPFFVGGVDSGSAENVLERIGMNKSFSGCIRNFMLNGERVGEPTVQKGTIPCSKRVEPGMFFYPGNGSNWFRAEDKFIVGKKIDIQMEIKPRASSGLLFAVHGRNDYVVLEMINGTIKFIVKASRGEIETSFVAPDTTALCDGNWHKIKAVKNKNAAILSVDHKAAPPGIGTKNIGAVGTKHPIYIGGHPNLESDKHLKGSMSRAQFVGCIKDVYINEKPYSLNPAQTHGKVMADVCPTI